MGRPGRYTLAVMAWVAAYAGWSTLLGLVVATATGRELNRGDVPDVSLATSTLFTVVLPLVPTLVALWFNDWARDGFPTKAERKAAVPPTPEPSPSPILSTPSGESPAQRRQVREVAAKFPVAPLIKDD